MDVINTKVELQRRTLRQMVRLIRVHCRRGSFRDIRIVVAASDLGCWLAPPLLLSDLAMRESIPQSPSGRFGAEVGRRKGDSVRKQVTGRYAMSSDSRAHREDERLPKSLRT